MTKWLFNIAWALMLLLIVGAFIIASGSNSNRIDPSTASYGPSGASALADLLRLRGYRIVSSDDSQPTLHPSDVVLAFTVGDSSNLFDHTSNSSGDQVSTMSDSEQESIDRSTAFIQKQIARGVVVFWLTLPEDFEEASAHVKPAAFDRVDGKTRLISATGQQQMDAEDGTLDLLSSGKNSFVSLERSGSGFAIRYADAVGLTNRFIGSADNAQFLVEALKAFAPNAKRIVFTRSTYKAVASPGLLETIGPWAEGAWYQMLFLGLVIVVTLNRRFGLPRQFRQPQTGSRELVDAYADTLERASATSFALANARLLAEMRLKKLLKHKLHPTLTAFPGVETALVHVVAAQSVKTRSEAALDLIVKLENEVDSLVRQRQTTSDLTAKQKNLL